MSMLLIAVLLLCLGEIKARGCNGERKLLSAPKGRLESPEGGENGTCFWNISVAPQFRIIFYFISYEIDRCHSEKCTGCTSILLRNHVVNPAWSKICQDSMPEPIESAGSSLLIDFILLKEDSRSSFIAEYITTTFEATIDLRKTSTAVISSPNFPGKYPRNSYYRWSIIAPSGYRVKVKFSKFDIKHCAPVCSCDFLRVYDGTSKQDSFFKRYCNANRRLTIVTSGEHMWMEFVSSVPKIREHYGDNLGFEATVTKEIRLYVILVPCVLGILIVTLFAVVVVCVKRRRQHSPGLSSPVMKMSLLDEDDGVGNTQISDASQPDQESLQPIQPVYLPTTQSIK